MSKETSTTNPALKPADYRSDYKPIWCPGCGHFAVISSLTKALSLLNLPRENVAIVSGIGCSSRIPAYSSVYGFHSVHGRALAVATGLKVARPELTVVVAGGDGDGFSIGGNHFIQACRRNVDLTYLVMDNAVYGMTKGQASPTTDASWTKSKLTPEGTGVTEFQPLRMALAAGASYIARAFSGDPNMLTKYCVDAIEHKGFSMIQVLSPCITWRPEQKEWKNKVHDGFADVPTNDERYARLQLMDDDGFTVGVLFKSDTTVPFDQAHESVSDLAEIGKQFLI